jgi:5-deoxy-glucuronate isomerase
MADVDITPESAGWRYAGLRTASFTGSHTFTTEADEAIVLPLSGSCTVRVGDSELLLRGRLDVFAGATDFAYIPRGSTVTLTASDAGPCRVALLTARAEADLPFRYGARENVPIEKRGAGPASRTVRNFCVPETFDTGQIDILREVTAGDVVLIPYGYHGPSMAMPGYDLYYLNVLAGAARGPHRSMSFTDDPQHAWVRDTWGA